VRAALLADVEEEGDRGRVAVGVALPVRRADLHELDGLVGEQAAVGRTGVASRDRSGWSPPPSEGGGVEGHEERACRAPKGCEGCRGTPAAASRIRGAAAVIAAASVVVWHPWFSAGEFEDAACHVSAIYLNGT
jgi:hypothetical protein